MFVTHLVYREGSRPSQCFPWCEKENADAGLSDGQTATSLASTDIGDVTCSYCHHAFLRQVYADNPELPRSPSLPVHWSVAPRFSRDGRASLLHWEARCGQVETKTTVCLSTRNPEEITCPGCLAQHG